MPGADPESKGNIVKDRHVPEQGVMLEDETHLALAHIALRRILAVEKNPAAISGFKTRNNTQQGGLATPGGPEERNQLTAFNLKVDVLQGLKLPEALDHIFDLDTHVW